MVTGVQTCALPILVVSISWAAFSLWIMHHFQQIYTVDPYPAWLIDNIKDRFLRPDYPIGENLLWGMKTSVAGRSHSLIFVYTLFAPVGIIFPLLSPIILLSLPELAINLVTTIPLFYPTWHYNIVVGCFILIGCAAVIGQVGKRSRLPLPAAKVEQLSAWFICFCVLSHSFLWVDYLSIKRHPAYLAVMKQAINLIPKDASVSAPKRLVSHVSSRDDYFLLEDQRKGDYILIDQNETVENPVMSHGQNLFYKEIFEKDGVRIYQKE
jgi:hypothetical protein